MKRRSSKKICAVAAAVLVVSVGGMLVSTAAPTICAQDSCGSGCPDAAVISDAVPGSCTIFAASYGDVVLYGNNEDYINPNTYYWVVPPSEGNYGGVYLGFDDLHPQGGVNEKGLAFDGNALPPADLNPHSELPSPPAGWIVLTMMKKCATVQEAIDLAERHTRTHWGIPMQYQVLLADATGDAVVISAGPDGELAFTRKQEGDGYLVSTNFNRANPENGGYPCWRYDTAVKMLEKIQDEDDLTVDYFASILDAVHVESASGNTLYSNVFDLRNGLIYLYHWHQFDEVATLNVAEEIARAPSPTRIRDLFSEETVERALREHRGYEGWTFTGWSAVALIWLLLTAGSLAALIWYLARGGLAPTGTEVTWVFIVLFFGPLGLLTYLLSYRQPMRSPDPQAAMTNWRRALGATAYSVAGYAMALVLVIVCFVHVLPSRGPVTTVAISYAVPFIVGLLVFRTPPLASRLGGRYGIALRRSILAEVISANLAFAGMFPTGVILIDRWFPYNVDLGNPLFWLVMALVAVAGAVVVYPYNAWLAGRRFIRWPLCSSASGEATEADDVIVVPSLRNAWLALLLSFVLLIVSVGLLMTSLS